TPNSWSLQYWGSQLKGHWRRAFERKFGNILSLVNVEVQPMTFIMIRLLDDSPSEISNSPRHLKSMKG
ncbi:hypothetical protein CR513_25595, partial [Mucuna pruriens]